jgi:hypothetical protein
VARPRRGSVAVRVWGCPDSIDTFDPADCSQAVSGFDLRLITEGGDVIGIADADVESDGTVTWTGLSLGTYVFQQPQMLPAAVTYYAPGLTLAPDGAGYVVGISADEPVATIDVYNLPAPTDAEASTLAPSAVDSDGDRLSDGDEAAFGTDPGSPDTDADGYFDGDEINLGTDPLDAGSFPAG